MARRMTQKVLARVADLAGYIVAMSEPEPNSGCWLWTGQLAGAGYPTIYTGEGGMAGRRRYAHRTSYEVFVGSVPSGLVVDHRWNTPCCVNPDHLRPATQRHNVMRGSSPWAINRRKTHCLNGHEYTEDTTYTHPDGARSCRACRRKPGARPRRRRPIIEGTCCVNGRLYRASGA